jgi:hypothetical protein
MLASMIILMAFMVSCSKVAELTAVDITYTLPRTTFTYTPVTLKAGEEVLYSDFIKINVDSLLNANGLSSGTVKDPTFTQFSITITAPSGADFGWLQSARAVVADNAGFTSAVQIGSVVNAGGTGKTVVLTVSNSVIPFGSNGFYLRLYGVLTGPVPYQWVQMYFDSELKLTLQPV